MLVVDAQQLMWRGDADERLRAVVTGAIQLVALQERAAAAGIDPDELLALVAPVPVENVELGIAAGRGPDDEAAAAVMSILLLMAIVTYGNLVLTGVVEEKSSRVVEVLLARMPARNLLAGKVAGIGLLGFGQFAVHRPGGDRRHRRGRRRRPPCRQRWRARLGRRLVRARLRPVCHGIRGPRLARLTH